MKSFNVKQNEHRKTRGSRGNPNRTIVSIETNINPQSFKTSQKAFLSVKLENYDQENAHNVRLYFITHEFVGIFLGLDELAKGNLGSGNYTYDLILQPGQKVEQPFTVKVTSLPVGIAEQKFSITVEVLIDGILQDNLQREVKFTVEKD